MRYLFLFLLFPVAACEPEKSFPVDTDSGDSQVGESGDSAPDSSDTVDTAESGDTPCSSGQPIELVGIVEFPDSDIYDMTANEEAIFVTRPTAATTAGVVERWDADRIATSNTPGSLLEADYDAPDAAVVGSGRGQYLGITTWRAGDLVCSQQYGLEDAGELDCWPAEASGAVADVAAIQVAGEEPSAYFGYGYAPDPEGSEIVTWESQGTGDLYQLDTATGEATYQFSGACELTTYCHQGRTLGDSIILVSDFGGIYSYADNELAWSEETSMISGPVNLSVWGSSRVLFGSPFATDGNLSRVYTERGEMDGASGFFYSDVETDTPWDGSGSYIAIAQWTVDPGEAPGVILLYNARTGEVIEEINWTWVLGEATGVTADDWSRYAYIRMTPMSDGMLAFAVRNGRYAGIIRICSVTE